MNQVVALPFKISFRAVLRRIRVMALLLEAESSIAIYAAPMLYLSLVLSMFVLVWR
jgi:hypothetical protein